MPSALARNLILGPLFLCAPLLAQSHTETASPAAKIFHDPIYHVSFDYPATWTFSRVDGEISTFHLDARTAPRRAELRAVVAFPENPFPASTFTGGYLYFSVTPRTSASACRQQAAPPVSSPHRPGSKSAGQPATVAIAGISFAHGHDELKNICITQRDEAYTARRGDACLRFDLAINTFCGGEVSGVKDITVGELEGVRARLQSILMTIRFDPR